jgi:sortase A
LLAGWTGVWLEGRVYQSYRNNQLNRWLRADAAAGTARPRLPAPPSGVMGRLEIPRVGISVLVLNSVDATTLLLGAGRLSGTPPAGDPGNLVIAAHRDTFFRPLRDIRRNDRIEVTTPEGTYSYTVQWTSVVSQSDTSPLAGTRQPSLTLVTCYPFEYIGPAPRRFIVRALLDPPVQTAPTPALEVRPSPFLARGQTNSKF